MFNVAIINGEECPSYEGFKEKCINLLSKKAEQGENIVLYSSGDSFVDRFAKEFGIVTMTIFCDWKRDGKNALKYWCENIAKACDAVVFFDDGKQRYNYLLKLIREKGGAIRRYLLTDNINP